MNSTKAAKNQALDPTAVHGVTPFFDLSEEEFEARFMGSVGENENFGSVSGAAPAPILAVDGLPFDFDWRCKGVVTDIKMQGMCGSCWAFSTIGAIEGANFIATGELVNLSEQQLIDCDHMSDAQEKSNCDNGCNRGLMTNAYKYLLEAEGLEDETSYPYTGTQGDYKFIPEKAVVKLVNFTIIPLDENQIATNLVQHGPLAVGLNAAFMQTYIRGVSSPLICSKRRVNHGALLVGYGAKGFALLRLGYMPPWLIKNSCGQQWGDHGYYRHCKGLATCGINTTVSAVTTTPP